MPAVSQAQRAYLFARFGSAWAQTHHFDNPGPLPAHAGPPLGASPLLQPIPTTLANSQQGPPPGVPASIQLNTPHPDTQKLEQQLAPALDILRGALNSPQTDPVMSLDIRKAEMAVAKVLADLHKEQQAALGGGPATNFLRRNSG